jgi:hypothetical protein
MDVVEGYKKSLKDDEEFLKKLNDKEREKYSESFKEKIN